MSERKKVGLALGGGAARGFAHIGVLKVLKENNIPIDYIAGCSMGALVGGIYASWCDLDLLQNLAVVFDQKKYFDFALSSKGYVRGNKIQDLVKLMTKNIDINQTKIPFSCIATCIEDCELVRFVQGPIHEAVRASISIPGVFLPHVIDGKSYIDGCVIDRTAIDAAKQMGSDVVISVDVSFKGGAMNTPKGVISVLQSAFSISDWYLAQKNLKKADVLIYPEIDDIDGMKYKDTEIIIRRGIEAAQQALPKIKELIGMS